MIKAEMEAREISDIIKVHEVRQSDSSRRNVWPTASTLTTRKHNPGRECIYCNGEHYLASCGTVTNVPARKEALKEGRCFLCLARGHHATQCCSSKGCRKCSHRHHQSLCEIDNSAQNTESTSPLPSQPTSTTAALSRTTNFCVFCWKFESACADII